MESKQELKTELKEELQQQNKKKKINVDDLDEDEIMELLNNIRSKSKKQSMQVQEGNLTKSNIFKPEFSMIILGNSRAGKTTFITGLFDKPEFQMKKHFSPKNIILISPNADTDPKWVSFVNKHLKPDRQFKYNEQVVEDMLTAPKILQNLIDDQRSAIKSKFGEETMESKLVIIDDVVNTSLDIKNDSLISQLYTQGRHLRISPVLLSQSHKSLGNTIRRNNNYWVLFQLNLSTEIESVAQELRLPKMDKHKFEDIYEKGLSEQDFGFIFLNMMQPPQNRIIFNLKKVIHWKPENKKR